MDVSSDIQNLKGIGVARARMLSKLGIKTIKDALFFFPRDYQDLTPLTFRQGKEDETGAFLVLLQDQLSVKNKTWYLFNQTPNNRWSK